MTKRDGNKAPQMTPMGGKELVYKLLHEIEFKGGEIETIEDFEPDSTFPWLFTEILDRLQHGGDAEKRVKELETLIEAMSNGIYLPSQAKKIFSGKGIIRSIQKDTPNANKTDKLSGMSGEELAGTTIALNIVGFFEPGRDDFIYEEGERHLDSLLDCITVPG